MLAPRGLNCAAFPRENRLVTGAMPAARITRDRNGDRPASAHEMSRRHLICIEIVVTAGTCSVSHALTACQREGEKTWPATCAAKNAACLKALAYAQGRSFRSRSLNCKNLYSIRRGGASASTPSDSERQVFGYKLPRSVASPETVLDPQRTLSTAVQPFALRTPSTAKPINMRHADVGNRRPQRDQRF